MQNEITTYQPRLKTASEQGTAHHLFRAILCLGPESVFMGTAKNRWVTTTKNGFSSRWHCWEPEAGVAQDKAGSQQDLGAGIPLVPTPSWVFHRPRDAPEFWGLSAAVLCPLLLLQAAGWAVPPLSVVTLGGMHVSVACHKDLGVNHRCQSLSRAAHPALEWQDER